MAESSGAPPKPAKRSFFKKSSWQTAPEKPENKDDPTQMFSRAHESFKEIIAEEEQRRREDERVQRELFQKKQLEAAGRSKKRKITEEPSNAQHEDIQGFQVDTPNQSRKLKTSSPTPAKSPGNKDHRESPTRLSARHSQEASGRVPQKARSSIISLEDSDDSGEEYANGRHLSGTARLGDSRTATLSRWNTSDEPKRSAAQVAVQKTGVQKTRDPFEEELDSFDPYLPDRSASAAKPVEPAGPEPAVDVLITCNMPGFQEQLVIKIPYSMRFGVVREEWCKHQNLPPEVARTILLTYKGKRLWNSTSSRSIGITPDTIDDRGGPMLEAITEKLLAEAKQRELKALQALQHADDSDDAPAKPRTPKIKLTLKSKGYAEFKLQVHSDSTFERIAGAFRKSRNVPAHKIITIMFDGEPLSPQTKISETEIEETECLDVYVK